MQKEVSLGFTLLELLVVVAIIAILAVIAYPNYQNYITRTKRVEMMTEMQNIGRQLESRKLAVGRGGYAKVQTDGLTGAYPKGNTTLYNVTISDIGMANSRGNWKITATPVANTTQSKDGNLTLDYLGVKCRASKCGMAKEWNEN